MRIVALFLFRFDRAARCGEESWRPRERRIFSEPHNAEALRTRAAREVALSSGRAAARLTQLIDSTSQRVALEATKFSLGVAGIKPPSDSVSVNVGVAVAGWVIDLSGRDEGVERTKIVAHEAGQVIDAEPIAGIGPGAKPVG